MKGLILAGGSGTRLRPFTHTSAKQLIPIANKPVIEYVVNDLKNAGITNIGVIVGHTKKEIINVLGDGSNFGVNFTYIDQDAPRGLAHAVLIAKEFVQNEPFVMYLGDNMLSNGISEMVEEFKKNPYDAFVKVTTVENPKEFGVAAVSEEGTLTHVVEKSPNPPSNLALVGVYIFKPESIYHAIGRIKPSKRGELEITDAIQELVNLKYKIGVFNISGWFKDTGKPNDVLEANKLCLEKIKTIINGKIGEGVKISGHVVIGNNSIVEGKSTLVGPLVIAENCVINNSTIGPNCSIGKNTNIKNTAVENSIIIGDCEIEYNQKINNSLIGKNVKILKANNNEQTFYLGEHSEIFW